MSSSLPVSSTDSEKVISTLNAARLNLSYTDIDILDQAGAPLPPGRLGKFLDKGALLRPNKLNYNGNFPFARPSLVQHQPHCAVCCMRCAIRRYKMSLAVSCSLITAARSTLTREQRSKGKGL